MLPRFRFPRGITAHEIGALVTLAFAMAMADPAAAQPSPQDQLAAVQEACTIKDFVSHCSSIAPGSPELVLCLRANAGELSPACQSIMRAIPAAAMTAPPITAPPAPAPVVPPAPAAPTTAAVPKQPTSGQLSAIRSACRSGFTSYCTGVKPGGEDALRCLELNKAGVSQSCQIALAAVGGRAASFETTTQATPPAAKQQPHHRMARPQAVKAHTGVSRRPGRRAG
jgi:hypothetical protein